jgi:hypothetical protein
MHFFTYSYTVVDLDNWIKVMKAKQQGPFLLHQKRRSFQLDAGIMPKE